MTNLYQLAPNASLDFGLTGMAGVNNRRGYVRNKQLIDEPWRKTLVAGADLTFSWVSPRAPKERGLVWRTEFYYAQKDRNDDQAEDTWRAWGLYSYFQHQPSPRARWGVRGDVALPLVRNGRVLAADLVPLAAFQPSRNVQFRLEYRHGTNLPYVTEGDTLARRTDDRVLFQIGCGAELGNVIRR